jgi:signal peptidase I
MNVTDEEVNTTPDTVTQLPLEGEQPAPENTTTKFSLWSLVYEILETIVLAAIIWLAVNFATARFIVEGSSMEPNFHTGQMLIVSKLAYKLSTPQRGDVIVFQYPGNPVDDYIKRVIGIPGDTVDIQSGRVSINGHAIPEPYLAADAGEMYQGKWTVPEGSYFVMGDNRSHSSDSRSWGMLSKEFIIGKAWVSYWPPKLWGFVPQVSYSTLSP